MREVTRNLPVTLSPEELDQRRAELSAKVAALREAEQTRKDTAKKLKEEEDTLRAQVCALNDVTESGVERRNVNCVERVVLGPNLVHVIRLDTHETVESRAATDHEIARAKQTDMFAATEHN